jgi:hypothetical protein
MTDTIVEFILCLVEVHVAQYLGCFVFVDNCLSFASFRLPPQPFSPIILHVIQHTASDYASGFFKHVLASKSNINCWVWWCIKGFILFGFLIVGYERTKFGNISTEMYFLNVNVKTPL